MALCDRASQDAAAQDRSGTSSDLVHAPGKPQSAGMRYDAIVVGAGPAGCAAAWDLAAAGKSVLLLDRRRFPRVKPCAGGITIKTLRRLRYPVTPVVREVCTSIVVRNQSAAPATLQAKHAVCAMTVRAELDAFCLGQTIERGAEFRVVRHIRSIREEADEVVLESDDVTWRAPWLVGADGANSVVRRMVPGFTPLAHAFAIEACVPTADPPPMEFDFGVAPRGYGWLFPKGDHVNVGLYTSAVDARPGRDALALYVRSKLGDVVLGDVVGHHIGVSGWRGRVASARVALAGDAAGLVEPLLGEGIHNAVASGQAAAAAILEAAQTRTALTTIYPRHLRPVLHDVRTGSRDAAWFYDHLDLGCRILCSRPAAAVLMTGYARGMTVAAIRRRWFLLPFTGRRPLPLQNGTERQNNAQTAGRAS